MPKHEAQTSGAPLRLAGVRAVVFDLDGTLVDAFDDIGAAANHALRTLGLSEHPLAVVRGFVGNGLARLAERALGPEQLEHRDRMVQLMIAYYREHPAVYARPYPGAVETLRALRGRGVRTALLSNKWHDITVAVLRALGLDRDLDVIQGEDPALGRKPDPRGLLATLERLGVGADEAALVGDGEPDAGAARNAGVRFIGVTYGLSSAERLAEWGAITVLDDLRDLIPLVAGGD